MLIISLGGSLINKNRINIELLRQLKTFLINKNFVIITGGGRVAREYQRALSQFNKRDFELDSIGIKATELNAFLVSKILNAKLMSFNDFSNYIKSKKRSQREKRGKYRVVSFGIKPGFTTDFVSTKFASLLREKTIINMSRIRFVRVNNKPVKQLYWRDYLSVIPKRHSPGLKVPFDVKASKLAMKENMRVVFIKTVEELKNFIDNKNVRGTIIN